MKIIPKLLLGLQGWLFTALDQQQRSAKLGGKRERMEGNLLPPVP